MFSAPTVPGKTINELLKYWASTHKRNTPAFVSFSADGKRRCLNRKEVYQLASAFAFRLINYYGITKGDIICIALQNSLERIICDMGVLLAGATSMNGQILRADGQDFLNSLKVAKAKFVITDPGAKVNAWQFLKDKVENTSNFLVQQASFPDLQKVILCQRDEYSPDNDFITQLRLSKGYVDVSVLPSQVATVMTTSGSTGYSKLVPFTHANICHFCLQVRAIEPFKEGDHFMNSAPLGWAGGYPQWYLGSGVTRYFIDMRDGPPTDMASFVWNIITSERIIYAFMSPMYSSAILNDPSLWDNADWKPRILCLAGQPINQSHLEVIGKLCQAVDINYGMTECNLVSTHRIEDPSSFENGCAGFPGYGIKVKIVDKNKQEVSRGTIGEILLQGPSLTSGYLNNDTANNAAFIDGWLCTDDAGYINPQTSKLHIEGRQSDSIMRGSYLLYPGWLEQIIRKLDSVKDVILVPVPDKILHNEICACIVTDVPLKEAMAGSIKLKHVPEDSITLVATNSHPSTSNSLSMKDRNEQNKIDETDKASTLFSSVLPNGSLKMSDLEDIRKSGMNKPLNVTYNQTLAKSDSISTDESQQYDEIKSATYDYQHAHPLLKLEQEIRRHCYNSQVLHSKDSMRQEPLYYVFFNKFALTSTGKASRKEIRKLALSALNKD